jgi:hypothetical protein
MKNHNKDKNTTVVFQGFLQFAVEKFLQIKVQPPSMFLNYQLLIGYQ